MTAAAVVGGPSGAGFARAWLASSDVNVPRSAAEASRSPQEEDSREKQREKQTVLKAVNDGQPLSLRIG